jgi:probable HAF family extracellular repeat protein
MRRTIALVFLGAAILFGALLGSADARQSTPASPYTITDLGALAGDSISTALGLNAAGDAVGYSQHVSGAAPHAVLFSGGAVIDLGVLEPNHRGSRALALGPGATVYGYSVGAGCCGAIEPVLFSSGNVTALPLPAGDSEGAVFGVNSLGNAVGYTEDGNEADFSNRPHGSHAVRFSNGVATLLGALPGDSQGAAYGINDAGQVVGYSQGASRQHAVLFSGGAVTDLGALPGDTDSAAFSINASGQAVGYSAGAGRFHPVMFSGGAVIPLAELGGQRNEQALSVNASGVAVGVSDSDGFHHHAVLYANGGAFALEAQLPAGSGWTLETANAINDAGQIVGQGTHNGETHAYLLTPTGAKPSGGHMIPADANPAPPASLKPNAPKVTVRYDYMVLPGLDGHSDAPDPAAIQAVVDAFAKHGIRLAVEPTHAAIPERDVVTLDVPADPSYAGPDAVSSADLKATYFPGAPASVRYGIFTFFSDCDSPTHCDALPGDSYGQTGKAEIAGQNFLISLGNFLFELGAPPRLTIVGGTFMHELGHTLGLHHGGGLGPEPCSYPTCEDAPNYKPNYLSVMNYAYQFSGIPYASTPGSIQIAGFRLDYSTQVLPTGGNTPGALSENANLNEPAGLGSGNADMFLFTDGQCNFGIAPTDGPVDWNGDGDTTDTNATADLNPNDHPVLACTVTSQVLNGHDDWTLLLASLQAHPDGLEVDHPSLATEASSKTLARQRARLFHSVRSRP